MSFQNVLNSFSLSSSFIKGHFLDLEFFIQKVELHLGLIFLADLHSEK